MKQSIDIQYGRIIGKVVYDMDNRKIVVNLNNSKKKRVENYLSKKKEFQIPESQKIDDYRIDKAYPKDSQTYFELAMCELYTHTGVWVDWKTEKFIEED